MFKVLVENSAEKDLKKLPRENILRISKALQELSLDSRPAGCKKLINTANRWRIRVGDYRIVYEIYDETKIIRIFRIRHRKEVYD